MPDVRAITPISYGYNEDRTLKQINPGEQIKMGKTADLDADPPVFDEQTIYEYINGGVAVDTTRELNGWLPPGLDEATLLRDQFLIENGYPVSLDASNQSDQHIPQPNPQAEGHKLVADQIESRTGTRPLTPAEKEAEKAKATKPAPTTSGSGSK